MDRAAKRLEILQSQAGGSRPQTAREFFRFVLAGQWKLGEARFSAAEVDGRTEFRGADGRRITRACAFPLSELRSALAEEYGARSWKNSRRPLNEVAQGRIDGELVAVRLEESATRTALHIEFLVPRDDTRWQRPIGPVRISI